MPVDNTDEDQKPKKNMRRNKTIIIIFLCEIASIFYICKLVDEHFCKICFKFYRYLTHFFRQCVLTFIDNYVVLFSTKPTLFRNLGCAIKLIFVFDLSVNEFAPSDL